MTNTPQENGQTSSNPDDGVNAPINFICHNPANPDEACPICGGKGMISYDVPLDDKRFGKVFRCPNHHVSDDTERQERLRKIGNLEAYKGKTFENFQVNPANRNYAPRIVETLNNALASAIGFARNPAGSWLVLEGTYGCGKTHLAVAIGNARLEQFGDKVLFITAPDLLDYLRTTYSPSADMSYDETFERVRNIQLLILDDLGVENPSAWAKEKLFQLLNHRYSNHLATVITTNMELDELDPRISSRMMEGAVVTHIKIEAPDYRPSQLKRNEITFSKLEFYSHCTFENFDTRRSPYDEVVHNLSKALEIAKEHAENPKGWLFLMGRFGSGKTHLAAAIANHRQARGDQVVFTTIPDLLDYLRVTFDPKTNVRFDKRFQTILDAPFLVLDDLSMESATAWAKEKLFQILDYRYIRRLPTIITTYKALEEIDDRLATRLADRRVCVPFEIKAESYTERQKRF